MGTPSLARPKIAGSGILLRGYWRVVAHWRAILLLLLFGLAASLVIQSESIFLDLVSFAVLLIFIASQIFWIGRVVDLGEWLLPGKLGRVRLVILADLVYLFVIAYSFPNTIGQGHTFRMAYYRLPNIVIEAVFWWWFVGSMLAFAFIIAFATADRAIRASAWAYRKARQGIQGRIGAADPAVADPPSRGRRRFLEQSAVLISATPFVAVGYGFLHGRLDVEVVRRRIRLAGLPKAFETFQIAQLSDLHIGPFTTADFIRRCVAITNELNPDLIALTGDYVAWDTETQGEVVHLLAGLRAPYGVFGCLGNHEEEGEIEESITRLFKAQGIHILRQERVPIQLGGETLNLIGIDEPHGRTAAEWRRDRERRLQQIQELTMPDTVNILLSHSPYPGLLDRAAELGVDLTLAGHTHGGQLSLDSLSRGLNLSQLLYRYNSGWYAKDGAQLYVNRGIGTTGFPFRLGARPEITLLELARI